MNNPLTLPFTSRRSMRGFTLIEIMVVVVIIGILSALIVPNVMNRLDQARTTKAVQDLRAIETALDLYYADNHSKYPTTDQGLKALIVPPSDARNWNGPYLKGGVKKDPWDNEYQYANPGQHGQKYDLFTYGADNQEGGEGNDKDIGNWTLE
jgi:general secretion pathway protein G